LSYTNLTKKEKKIKHKNLIKLYLLL